MPSAKLIVGLGNPGKGYALTRHNVGFMVVDALASEMDISLKEKKALEGFVGVQGDVVLLKPTTYMNLSGQSVQKVIHYYKVEEWIVVCDDVALPFGKLRMREKGSSGGHNGLKDITSIMGDFPRLRVGVSSPGHMDLADYVLANFSEGEQNTLPEVIGQAKEVCKTWLISGFEKAARESATVEGLE